MRCECDHLMVKNGYYKGRQNWRCLSCGKTKVEGSWKIHLSEYDRERCVALVTGGATYQCVADAFGITRQTVGNFVKKKKSI